MIDQRSDLVYVYQVIERTVRLLQEKSTATSDVTVAAKYIQVSRDFPLSFLAWAAGMHTNDVARNAEGRIPPWTQKVREVCEKLPLVPTVDGMDSGIPFGDTTTLPPTCIEAFILVSSDVKTEADMIAAKRKLSASVSPSISTSTWSGMAGGYGNPQTNQRIHSGPVGGGLGNFGDLIKGIFGK
jgi:hypothetical protein